MFKKCLFVSVLLHIVLIISAGFNSPDPSAQPKMVYFQLISAEISGKYGTEGPSFLSKQAKSYLIHKSVQTQQSEIPKIGESKDSSFDTGNNQNQIEDATSDTVSGISLTKGNQADSGIANQPGEKTANGGNGLREAGNSEERSNNKQARIKKDFMPIYPKEAREKGWEGVVKLEVIIDKDGRVGKITIIESSGHQLLDDEAIKAMKKRRYQPAIQDGKPIESIRQIPIRFKLED